MDQQPSANAKWISECFCPKTGRTREVGASLSYLDKVSRYLPRWLLHTMSKLMPIVLCNPDAVWEGVRDPDPGDDRWGYCYCKHFPNKVDNNGASYPNRTDQVLSVYTNADFLIFEVRWDESEVVEGVRVPLGHAERFGRRVK